MQYSSFPVVSYITIATMKKITGEPLWNGQYKTETGCGKMKQAQQTSWSEKQTIDKVRLLSASRAWFVLVCIFTLEVSHGWWRFYLIVYVCYAVLFFKEQSSKGPEHRTRSWMGRGFICRILCVHLAFRRFTVCTCLFWYGLGHVDWLALFLGLFLHWAFSLFRLVFSLKGFMRHS